MTPRVDLKELSVRESEQVEWKKNVANVHSVVATLSAFANDLSGLGGGYVVCGAEETKDEHGFQRVEMAGLTANRLKEVEGQVMQLCRDRVSPSIVPIVEELPSEDPQRRVLVFIMAATPHAHTFRSPEDSGKHYVRISRETLVAQNGVLLELLVRKNAAEPWDQRPCSNATLADLDQLAVRDMLTEIRLFDAAKNFEDYLLKPIGALIPSLCVREPLTREIRPRNFAILLFGKEPQRFVPGSFSLFSIYPGTDRSDPLASRFELPGTVIAQTRRLLELAQAQVSTLFDKRDLVAPNIEKYPLRALQEAIVNAVVHRDYQLSDPLRVTAFHDRIEIVSPGRLPTGVNVESLRAGRATAKWRNQSLAWVFIRLNFAQSEGQGIPTIIRVLQGLGSLPPEFDADEARVTCVVRAHPRFLKLTAPPAAATKPKKKPAIKKKPTGKKKPTDKK